VGVYHARARWVTSQCDKVGRKNGCIAYVLFYAASCVTKHAGAKAAPSSAYYWILMLGRILGGIATSLLFSAFDSWMVTEHKKRQYPEAGVSQTYSRATILNGLVAVSAGFVGQWASDAAGPVAPFDAAIVFMLIGLVAIVMTWYVDQQLTPPRRPLVERSFCLLARVQVRELRRRRCRQLQYRDGQHQGRGAAVQGRYDHRGCLHASIFFRVRHVPICWDCDFK
jgi:MFS family permease